MKCKQVQLLIGSNDDLPESARDHADACPDCSGFMQDVALLEADVPSLDAAPPSHLRSRIQDRLAKKRRGPDWRVFAVSAAIVAIIATPMVQVVAKRRAGQYIKGERIGTLPPFHAKFYGKNHKEPDEEASAEMWFSGFAIRMTMPQFDSISDIEHGGGYQYWKPDGVAEKRTDRWARTQKQITLAERIQILDLLGPVAPSLGVKLGAKQGVIVKVFDHEYKTVATTYRLPVTKPGTISSVETPTNRIVYQDSESGKIVRVELVATFPGGIKQTEIHDYEYVVPSDDKFEAATLKPTQTKFPVQEAAVKANKPGGG